MAKVLVHEWGKIAFFCPACKDWHAIDRKRWTFNGDVDKPTFNPSVLHTSGHYMPGHQGDCWCDYNKKHPDNPSDFTCGRCHSFVTDGKIQFLSDCTHELAGQIVELPDID